jgi:hypothetical protein
MRIASCSACLQNASMPNILIRNVPPEEHARPTAAAKERGQSLQRYALTLTADAGLARAWGPRCEFVLVEGATRLPA